MRPQELARTQRSTPAPRVYFSHHCCCSRQLYAGRQTMTLGRWNRRFALGMVLLGLACGGGGGGTTPPGPPADLVKSAGDAQNWYFNNPLPTGLSVTAVDVDGRAVPGVVITWAVASGGGAVTPTQSTTNANGVATTTDSVGGATIQMVSATFTGLSGPVSFTEHATTPPASAAVSVNDNVFSPASAVIKTGGTVTWTWAGSPLVIHNVTYTGGPTPPPAKGPHPPVGR